MILLLSLAHAATFPSDYSVPSEEPGWLLAASGTSSGGLVAGGRLTPADGASHAWLVALDADGEIVWELDETAGGSSFYAVEARDGRVAACGELVTEFGPVPFVWIGSETGTPDLVGSLIDVEGGCYAVTWTDDARVVFAGFDEHDEGATPWLLWWSGADMPLERVEIPVTSRLLDVTPAADGDLLLAGYEDESGEADAWIARTSPEGVLRWSAFVGGQGDDRLKRIEELPDGEVAVCGYTSSTPDGTREAWVARYTPAGEAVWSATAGGEGDDGYKSMHVVGDRIELVGDATAVAGDWDLYLAAWSVDGEALGEARVDNGGDDYGYDFAVLADGETVVIGSREVDAGGGPEMAGWVYTPGELEPPAPDHDGAGDTEAPPEACGCASGEAPMGVAALAALALLARRRR